MSALSTGFRRLALGTLVATFVLIVVGGIVRVSDSGLGCGKAGSGFHGWPLCEGDVVPGLDLNAIVEYTHRALAGAVGLMMIALCVWAWRRYRDQRDLVWATTAAVVLVIAQGLLGAATVEKNLDEVLVATHLGLAMVLLALTLYVWQAARLRSGSRPPDSTEQAVASKGPRRGLAVVASVAIFATIVAGGYMAGTQNYGRADYKLGDGAHHACGKEFPSCNGEFLPFGEARLVDIHLTHRVLLYIATLLTLALCAIVLARRREERGAARFAWLALAVLGVQLVLGALNVWLDEYEALIVAHLAVGTVLWGTLVALTFALYRVPAAQAAGSAEHPPRAEAVTV